MKTILSSVYRLRFLAFITFLFAAYPLNAQDIDLSKPKVQDDIRSEMLSILPKGWSINTISYGVSPKDWHTDSPQVGLLISGGNSVDRFEIYVLPLDWLGIRKVNKQTLERKYQERIFSSKEFKTVILSTDSSLYDYIGKSRWQTSSLVNSGFRSAMLTLGKDLRSLDYRSSQLVEKYTNNPDEFFEAAESLIVLGIPAKTVFLKAVKQFKDARLSSFVSVLGMLGGRDSVTTLCSLLSDQSILNNQKRSIASALRQHRDSCVDPALHSALIKSSEPRAIVTFAKILASHRYKPTKKDIRRKLEKMADKSLQDELRRSLQKLERLDLDILYFLKEEITPECARNLKNLKLGITRSDVNRLGITHPEGLNTLFENERFVACSCEQRDGKVRQVHLNLSFSPAVWEWWTLSNADSFTRPDDILVDIVHPTCRDY